MYYGTPHGVAVSFVLRGCGKPGEAKEIRLRYFYALNSPNYHKMKNLTLVLLYLLLASQSYAIGKKKLKKSMDSWNGHGQHELIVSWGPPARTADDGGGGQVLIYSYPYVTNGYYSFGQYFPSETWYRYRMFYVNASGVIYGWRTSNEQAPPQQVNLNVSRY